MHSKLTLPASDRTMIAVDRNVHMLIKRYAWGNNITIAEATYRLIGIALAHEWDSESNNSN
jgi:hypothetical protein